MSIKSILKYASVFNKCAQDNPGGQSGPFAQTQSNYTPATQNNPPVSSTSKPPAPPPINYTPATFTPKPPAPPPTNYTPAKVPGVAKTRPVVTVNKQKQVINNAEAYLKKNKNQMKVNEIDNLIKELSKFDDNPYDALYPKNVEVSNKLSAVKREVTQLQGEKALDTEVNRRTIPGDRTSGSTRQRSAEPPIPK